MKTHLVIVIERRTKRELKTYQIESDKDVYAVRREVMAIVEKEIKYGTLKSIRDLDWCIDSVEL